MLKLAGMRESMVVEGAGSRFEARNRGFETRFGPILKANPTRRYSMFDLIRAAPGVSPTSPASGTVNTVSAFGSGGNENMFLIDGTNFTCPCNGVSRAEPGIDVIQEIQVQSVGASAEFGNIQGAVFNVVTRQGGERFVYDASYYGQTSEPDEPAGASALSRAANRKAGTSAPGTVTSRRTSVVRCVAIDLVLHGIQYLRDYDSQPGADPAFPRRLRAEQDLREAHVAAHAGPAIGAEFHEEFWVNPERPTIVTPFETTLRLHASVPATTFGHLTHTCRATPYGTFVSDAFLFTGRRPELLGSNDGESLRPRDAEVTSGAPPRLAGERVRDGQGNDQSLPAGLLGADHEWKVGGKSKRVSTGRRKSFRPE